MTVEQLIEKLKRFDPALNVKTFDPVQCRWYDIEGVWDSELDDDNNPICSI